MARGDERLESIALSGEVLVKEQPSKIWVADLFWKAIEQRASDIVMTTPNGDNQELKVRIRVDGDMRDMEGLSVSDTRGPNVDRYLNQLIADVGLRIEYTPQQGTLNIGHPDTDEVRKARLQIFVDHLNGMVVQARLPDFKPVQRIEEIGILPGNVGLIKDIANYAGKATLLVGPMGCGKSSTANSLMEYLARSGKREIWTVEDPVERSLDGVHQISVRNSKENNVTMESILPGLVRSDYDILFIGETRSEVTAESVVDQGKVGRQVFSTMHADDGISALMRLSHDLLRDHDMGSTLKSIGAIISQRLIPKVNPDYEPGNGEPRYYGRIPVNEIVRVNNDLVAALVKGDMREVYAVTEHSDVTVSTFHDNVVELLREGIVDLDGVRRSMATVNLNFNRLSAESGVHDANSEPEKSPNEIRKRPATAVAPAASTPVQRSQAPASMKQPRPTRTRNAARPRRGNSLKLGRNGA